MRCCGSVSLRFFRVHPPESGVEHFDIIKQRARLDVIRPLRQLPFGFELILAQLGDRLHPLHEVLPELRNIVRAGKAPGHADDGNAL